MDQQFKNTVILITGAGSGIGRATSIKFAALGATLALTDINIDGLVTTKELCEAKDPPRMMFNVVDVSSSMEVAGLIQDIVNTHDHIDHVFNCAGINPTKIPTEDVTDEYYDRIMDTNLKGIFNITRACIPHLKSGSTITNISSTSGLRPSAQTAVYCASKAAIIAFSKSMALELGPRGIRVNTICPGAVETPTNVSVLAGEEEMEKMKARVALGRLGSVEEIADVAVFLMGDVARYVNGSVLEVSGGLS